MHRLSPFASLREAWSTLRKAWLPVVTVMFGFNLVMLVLVSPLIGWLFRESLRANGMVALDLGTLSFTDGISLTLALIFLILLLAFWLASLQFTVLVLMLHRASTGEPLTARGILGDVAAVARKLVRPSSMPLFFYLFLILPLSGFGFVSLLSQGISVPTFISGELLKSPVSAASWYLFTVILAFLNLRFSLSLPLFALTNATGGKSMRMSWRKTAGWAQLRLVLAVLCVMICAGALTLAVVLLAIVPTVITDAVAPAASVAVAAFSLGGAQVLGMLLTIVVTSVIVALLLSLLGSEAKDSQPASARVEERRGSDLPPLSGPSAVGHVGPRSGRSSRLILAAVCTVIAIAFGFVHLGTMQQLSQHPQTLVLGHRGFSDGGAENTIGGLEAAAAAGVDLVEIDVMQSADGRFVVMHDTSLARLAGMDAMVKDLTFDELTAITVRDQFGHEGKIPSLAEYITRANELEQPLLIEIKFSGAETPDHIERLVTELDELDGMRGNIFHTLDHASVERLKQLRPDASVGYILAFAGVDVPQTSADFIVVEEFTATVAMQQAAAAAGLGFFSWTVNDEPGIRELLRRDADGIITDHPDLALDARDEMQNEAGLSGVLIDALTKFVVVF